MSERELRDEIADHIEKYVIDRLRVSSIKDELWFHMALKELVLAADELREMTKRK